MEGKFSKIFKGDKTIWCIFIALCVISLLEVFSASSTIVYRQQNYWAPILRHGVFIVIGFFFVLFLQRVKTRYFSGLMLFLPVTWFLLILAMIIGEDVNGAQRWLGVGSITIQPSEFAKIALVGFMAFFLSRLKPDNEKLVFGIMMSGIIVTCGLIAPENLSTAGLLFGVCYLMMFIGQVNLRRLGLIAAVCVGSVFLLVGTLKVLPEDFVKGYLPDRFSTWQNRIDRHSGDDEAAPGTAEFRITDENYQVSHAKIAIANGNIIGMPGSGVERDFLPQAYSDFIFAIILEEMGFLGGIFVLLLYVALMIRAGVLASKCDKLFPRYLILGAAMMITIQALANMAVAVNLIPVTGQPLPLISRGGTSTIITCAYFGIILACSNASNYSEHEDVDEGIANIPYE
ncbi:cell division protein FtsW [Dysgonomonas sp. PH5-45]|uniref:FtsW/RodA/SpoVE family cell cycle protein n=1 Tax=unclassified Dysgonomonas TaxID=2630389 RepID=UPI002475220E|nr:MULTISPECIES: FtsW/RodA/SpoVE family cell cycle protein [unclassified Dysgonomonas]MDH6355718.1 cell division protein FtsW [Dysgonomonas sp. PH5-45]MDH6388615.1 cell division protein FtsW [Dysgonomonas sp. PH5-37]